MTAIQTLRLGDASLRYIAFGEGSRPLVIVPGMSLLPVLDSAPAVEEGYRAFRKTHRVYLFERRMHMEPGHGIKEMADDLADAMEKLSLCDADVFGASQGGMVAQSLAIRFPALVRKLILGSTLSRQNDVSRETFSEWERLSRAGDAVALGKDVFSRVYSEEFVEQNRNAIALLNRQATEETMEQYAISSAASLSFDLYDRLKEIRCPVLVLGAGRDRVLSVTGSIEIAEKLGCECFLYGDYGHAVYDTAPDYKDRIAGFFAG